jgi:hypothetical protein
MLVSYQTSYFRTLQCYFEPENIKIKCFYRFQEFCLNYSNSTPPLSCADFPNPGHDQYVYRHPNG